MLQFTRIFIYVQAVLIPSIYCCTISVDSSANNVIVDFDLTSMERPYGLTWTDRYTGMAYEATICNSARLMSSKCSIQNAVAMESNTCKAYGRYDSLVLTNFLDANHPENGIMLTYGNGGNCLSSTSGKSSVTFMIACEPNQRNSESMLYKVESSPDGCQHIYYFQGPAGCGKSRPQPSGGGGSSTSSNGGMIFLYCLLAVVVYFGLGTIYYRQMEGAEGMDAVPHIEYLRKASSWITDLFNSLLGSMSIGSSATTSARRMGSDFKYSAVANPEAIARSAKELGAAAGEKVSAGVHSAAQSVSHAAERVVPHIKAAGGQISKAVSASADKYIPPAIGKHFKTSAAAVNHTAKYDASINIAPSLGQGQEQGRGPWGPEQNARSASGPASIPSSSNPILSIAEEDDDEEETVNFGTEV